MSSVPSRGWVTPPEAGPSPTPASPLRANPTTPLRKPKRAVLAGVGAAVVVVSVAGLLLAGGIPGLQFGPGTKASPPASGSSEQSAAPFAVQFAANVTGGPWDLYLAVGFDATLGIHGPYDTGCPAAASPPKNFTVPGYNGSYATGRAEAWVFEFVSNGGTGVELFLAVQNDTVVELEETGPHCAPGPALPQSAHDLIDSTAAAAAVDATLYGSAYVNTHESSNASYAPVLPFGTFRGELGPTWVVQFTGCSGANLTIALYRVNATSGEVIDSTVSSALSYSCGEHRPLGQYFSMYSAQESVGTVANASFCRVGDQCYSVDIGANPDVGFTPANVSLEVTYSSNGTVYTVGAALGLGFTIEDSNGTIQATGGAPSTSGQPLLVLTWTTGATSHLVEGATLWIDLGTTTSHVGEGLQVVATGHGLYEGNVTASLP